MVSSICEVQRKGWSRMTLLQMYNRTRYRTNEDGLKMEEMLGLQARDEAVRQRPGRARREGSLRTTAQLDPVESRLPCGLSAWRLVHQDEGVQLPFPDPSREEKSI